MAYQDYKLLMQRARERLREDREDFKNRGDGSYDDFHRDMASILRKMFGVDVSAGWVRDQCNPENRSDPSFMKMVALIQYDNFDWPGRPLGPVFNEAQHEETSAPQEEDDPQQQVDGPREQGDEPRAADHGTQEEKISQVLAQDTEEKRLRPFKDPNRASWAVATIANRAFERQKKAGGQVGTLIDCALIYCQFRYDVKMSHMPLQSLRQAQTKELAKTLKIALPNAIALYNVLFDFLHNPHFPWGRDEDIQAEIETVQKAMEDEAKAEAKRLAKKQRPKTNAQMIRAIKGTAVKQKRLEKTA